jgi:hypothetical protein
VAYDAVSMGNRINAHRSGVISQKNIILKLQLMCNICTDIDGRGSSHLPAQFVCVIQVMRILHEQTVTTARVIEISLKQYPGLAQNGILSDFIRKGNW